MQSQMNEIEEEEEKNRKIKRLSGTAYYIRKRVAYLSTYPPRECGIATFTKDLVTSIDELGEYKPFYASFYDAISPEEPLTLDRGLMDTIG